MAVERTGLASPISLVRCPLLLVRRLVLLVLIALVLALTLVTPVSITEVVGHRLLVIEGKLLMLMLRVEATTRILRLLTISTRVRTSLVSTCAIIIELAIVWLLALVRLLLGWA